MDENFTLPDLEAIKLKTKEVYKEIYELIGHDEDACKFVLMYGEYVEMIDDIIDEEKNPELVTKAFHYAMLMFSTPFWIKHHQQLMLVNSIISNEYSDSILWEKDPEAFKRADAKCLSHCGYGMLFAVICLVAGYDALRKVSSNFRQWAHYKHRLPNH